MPDSTLTTTPAGVTRCRDALRQGERLWANGCSGSGEIDALRLRKGPLEGRWRWLKRWERLHTVWRWVGDDQEVLYDAP